MTLEEYIKYSKENEDWSPGFEAIEKAFSTIYKEQKPIHYATNLQSKANLGGDQYLDGYSIYKSKNGYKHIVTYGMSELYVNEASFGGEWSAWGYEMTFKMRANSNEECLWVFDVLANLAYFTNTQNSYLDNLQYIVGDGRALDRTDSKITGLIVVYDTEVAGINTLHGRVDFLQLVGVTQKELEWVSNEDKKESELRIKKLIEKMQADNPNLVTDMKREISYL